MSSQAHNPLPARAMTGGVLVAAGSDATQQVSGILRAAEGKKIKAVSAFTALSLAATEDGELLAAGSDHRQEVSDLLRAAEGKRIKAVAAGGAFGLAVTDDGALLAAGLDASLYLRAAEGKMIKAVSAGSGFMVAVTEDGTLLAAGSDDGAGQVSGLLRAAEGVKVAAVSAGWQASAALSQDGAVLLPQTDSSPWAELAQAVSGKRVTDLAVDYNRALAVTDGGTLLAFGEEGYGEISGILRDAEGKNIAAVDAAMLLSLAVTDEGTLLAAGNDDYQQVSGILEATAGKRVTAVAGAEHVLAVVQDSGQDCGPLKPQQICASLHTTGDPADACALVFKVEDKQQVLVSGQPCQALDTQSTKATHIVVRRVSTSQDLAGGSVYFTYNQTTGAVGIDMATSQLPAQLTCQVSGSNRLAFTWSP